MDAQALGQWVLKATIWWDHLRSQASVYGGKQWVANLLISNIHHPPVSHLDFILSVMCSRTPIYWTMLGRVDKFHSGIAKHWFCFSQCFRAKVPINGQSKIVGMAIDMVAMLYQCLLGSQGKSILAMTKLTWIYEQIIKAWPWPWWPC